MIQTNSRQIQIHLSFFQIKLFHLLALRNFKKAKSKNLDNKFVKELLEFKGVELVLLSKNFLSVKKTEDVT